MYMRKRSIIKHTSEGPETLEQDYLTRQTRFSRIYFWSGVVWKVILKKEIKMDHTKIEPADLDFPRRKLSIRGRGFFVTPNFGLFRG